MGLQVETQIKQYDVENSVVAFRLVQQASGGCRRAMSEPFKSVARSWHGPETLEVANDWATVVAWLELRVQRGDMERVQVAREPFACYLRRCWLRLRAAC